MTTPHPPQPPAMIFIRQQREKLGLSFKRAGLLAGISDSRWRQLENGYRQTKVGPVPEPAPARTLAKMALAVDVTAGQLRDSGCPEAAAQLETLAARQAAADDGAAADAARAAAAIEGLNAAQRDAITAEIASALSRIRDGKPLPSLAEVTFMSVCMRTFTKCCNVCSPCLVLYAIGERERDEVPVGRRGHCGDGNVGQVVGEAGHRRIPGRILDREDLCRGDVSKARGVSITGSRGTSG